MDFDALLALPAFSNNLLSFGEPTKSRAGQCSHLDENVPAAVRRRDEAELSNGFQK